MVERNIRTILRLRAKSERERSFPQCLADGITAFSGRLSFVNCHTLWFGIWQVLRMLRAIQDKRGIECESPEALWDLMLPTDPQTVLDEIERLSRHGGG